MSRGYERYQKDLDNLIERGRKLVIAAYKAFVPEQFKQMKLVEEDKDSIPNFYMDYQGWYSEAIALISQIAPERSEDFRAWYAPKNSRKEISFANYTISDALRGLRGSIGEKVLYDSSAAIEPMAQQYRTVAGLRKRFSSSLFDIRILVHAELLDDELAAADVLNGNGYQRGAGAIAGVVLEGHLAAVCARHSVSPKKKDPGIGDLNEALKAASVVEIAQWRFIQHLGDIRNKCDHKKSAEPTQAEVAELIEGVRKITKTVL